MSDQNNQQLRDEEAVFLKFVEKCPYPIQRNTIRNGQPPEPDILCELMDGTPVNFELVECVDNSVAKSIYGGSFKGGFFTDDFCLERIENKFRKSYSKACELLVYFDAQPIIAKKSWLPQIQSFIEENINCSPFKKVWVYSIPQNRIMLVHPA